MILLLLVGYSLVSRYFAYKTKASLSQIRDLDKADVLDLVLPEFWLIRALLSK